MKRLSLSIVLGALLGVLCIIGVGTRIPVISNEVFFIAIWYNRVIIGLVIGLAGRIKLNTYLRGAMLGLVVSFAFLLSTVFRDIMSFFAGIAYGLIIDYVATKYSKLS